MKKPSKIFNNIGLKILAVMFSVLLWLISVNINDPVDTEVYRNIPVEMENTSLLTDEGMTYEVLDDTDRVTVTVRANRSVLENINASDVTATADFSELSFTRIRFPSGCRSAVLWEARLRLPGASTWFGWRWRSARSDSS